MRVFTHIKSELGWPKNCSTRPTRDKILTGWRPENAVLFRRWFDCLWEILYLESDFAYFCLEAYVNFNDDFVKQTLTRMSNYKRVSCKSFIITLHWKQVKQISVSNRYPRWSSWFISYMVEMMALHGYTSRIICTVGGESIRLNIKTVLSTYGDFHVKDKTAVRTYYL